jgi:hypothetical protein
MQKKAIEEGAPHRRRPPTASSRNGGAKRASDRWVCFGRRQWRPPESPLATREAVLGFRPFGLGNGLLLHRYDIYSVYNFISRLPFCSFCQRV